MARWVTVKMLSTQLGAIDAMGTDVRAFQAGELATVPPSLAKVFIDNGWAEELPRKEAAKKGKKKKGKG